MSHEQKYVNDVTVSQTCARDLTSRDDANKWGPNTFTW